MDSAIRKVIKQWQERDRGLETDMHLVKKNVSDTKKDFKSIKEVLSNTKDDVKRLRDGVKSIRDDVSDTKDDVKSIMDGVKSIKDFSDMKDDLKIIIDDVKATKEEVRDTKEDVKSIMEDVSNTKDAVKSIKKDVRGTKVGVNNIKKDASDLKQSNVSHTKDYVKSIDKDSCDLKQEMHSQKETENTAEKAYVKMKSNLQDDLISFYKRMHRSVALSPLIEEEQPLLNFYEMPDILRVKVTRSRDGDRLEKTLVQGLGDVFYNEKKLCRNIYLTADAGYGKTAFSKKLALAWCHAMKPNKSEEKDFSKDEVMAMSGFSFVFLVPLRDRTRECEMDMLIWDQVSSQLLHDYSLKNLKTILCEETCLVILDGLDEWTHPFNSCRQGKRNIPHQRARENISVLTTTRPWKFSVIGLHSSQIDQKLELEGLSIDSAKKLKRSVISHLHGEQEKGKIDKYENEFNMTVQDSHKSDLTAIPLFLMFLLFLWYYKISVGKTLAGLYSSFIELLLSRTVNKDGIQIPKTETVQSNIPPCLDNNTLCNQFYTLLTTLGKLAFYTLFSETKENTLVFDGCIAEKYLSVDELRFCLKTGIITQSKVLGASLLQQKTKVSFAHKTMQEFLAALYINSAPDQKSVQEIVLSNCKCVKDILDMSKIFIFIVSISGKFSFSRELMKIINEAELTQEYRRSLEEVWYKHPLKDLQDMYITFCNEIPHEYEVSLCLQDVFIDYRCRREEYRGHLKQLTTTNKQNIRSVYINKFDMEYTPFNTARKVIDYFALSDLENIEKIHYRGENSDDYILPMSNSSVKSLSLSCDGLQGTWFHFLFDKVISLQKLEAISISNFKMSQKELGLLLNFISQRDCLGEIELVGISCTDQRSFCTGLCVDLSQHLSLRKLTLRWLNLSQVIINMASLENCWLDLSNRDLCLKFLNYADNKLNTLYCESLQSSAAIDEVLRVLRESRQVRQVIFGNMNLGRRTLEFPPDLNMKRLMLCSVTIEASVFWELVDSMLKLQHTVQVDILNCTVSPREEFKRLKEQIKASQRVRILMDLMIIFVFETIKDVD